MLIRFHPRGWEDYLHWQQTDKTMLRKVSSLIEAIRREPFSGLGKPEPLRHDLRGYWSRRITDEHRLVYFVAGDTVDILQCRYHYEA